MDFVSECLVNIYIVHNFKSIIQFKEISNI